VFKWLFGSKKPSPYEDLDLVLVVYALDEGSEVPDPDNDPSFVMDFLDPIDARSHFPKGGHFEDSETFRAHVHRAQYGHSRALQTKGWIELLRRWVAEQNSAAFYWRYEQQRVLQEIGA